MGNDKSAADEAVFALSKPSRCFNCDKKQASGDIVKLRNGKDETEVLCKTCAGLDGFLVIAAGNAKLTRIAKKYAAKHYKILRWSELWKTYERQGLLVDGESAAVIEKESGVKLSSS